MSRTSKARTAKIRTLGRVTGKRARGAANILNRQDAARRVQALRALLSSLQASSPFAVQIGLIVGAGAQAWYAESGAATTRVRYDDFARLLEAGAADRRRVHVLRSYRDNATATFSARCEACHAYVWCGVEERTGTCACKQEYRVVFDLAPVLHGTLEDGRVCMDCGVEETSGTAFPWHRVNGWQRRCHSCFSAPRTLAERTQRLSMLGHLRTHHLAATDICIGTALALEGVEDFGDAIRDIRDGVAAWQREFDRVVDEVRDGRDDGEDSQLTAALISVSRKVGRLGRRIEVLTRVRESVSEEVETYPSVIGRPVGS